MAERVRSQFGAGQGHARPARACNIAGRWRVAVALAVCGLIALLVAAPSPAPRALPPRAVAGDAPAHGGLSAPTPGEPALSVHAATSDVAEPALAAGQADICGIGVVDTSADDPDGAGQIPPDARAAASAQLVATLTAAGDDRVRAAGRLLQLRALPDVDAAAALDDLVRIATQSQDPAVYAAALEACTRARSSASSACGALGAWRWAALDPGNAAPWLRLAQEARDAGDDQALAAAIYQVSQSRRIDWHDDDLAVSAMRAIPRDASPLARTLDARAIADVRDAWTSPAYGGLATFCAAGADANRAPVCDASANLLVHDGGRAYETRLGIRMGHGLGWPARRLEDLRLQRDALETTNADVSLIARPYSCAAAGRLQQWASMRQHGGELGAQRVQMASAGGDIIRAVAQLRLQRAARRRALDEAPPGTTETDQ